MWLWFSSVKIFLQHCLISYLSRIDQQTWALCVRQKEIPVGGWDPLPRIWPQRYQNEGGEYMGGSGAVSYVGGWDQEQGSAWLTPTRSQHGTTTRGKDVILERPKEDRTRQCNEADLGGDERRGTYNNEWGEWGKFRWRGRIEAQDASELSLDEITQPGLDATLTSNHHLISSTKFTHADWHQTCQIDRFLALSTHVTYLRLWPICLWWWLPKFRRFSLLLITFSSPTTSTALNFPTSDSIFTPSHFT